SYVFDVSVSELFGWYLGGGRLAVLETGAEKEPRKIIQAIEKCQITHVNFVPSMFGVFLDMLNHENIRRLSPVKYIFLAGEVLPPVMVERFKALDSHIALENLYGPTEATIYASHYSLSSRSGEGSIPIGRPLQNTKLYIIDKYDQTQPMGIAGELCISGTGVALGYLNRPELTNEKFGLPTTLYRTGDLARWLPEGDVEFLGRIDQQVKIRGFRVELGEIENQLQLMDEVKEAVVMAKEENDGEKYLCAYYIPVKGDVTPASVTSDLKAHLSRSL
ncbi:MAG: amino acid adenylation domain-containing protein, partial [bacterium]|nr:amino acid adenylation domain-containing protein [bacterium]